MVNAKLLTLCSRAWCIQILSALGNGTQARISPLSHELGAGRTAVSASIQHLIELGFLKRNTGHGHPLRPEYLLTAKGITVSVWAAQFNSVLNNDDWQLARRMWTLPVLSVVTPTRRYGEIRFALKPVTDRALSQSLQIMCEQDWLCRSVDVEATPPRVSYSPNGIGKKLSPILQQVL